MSTRGVTIGRLVLRLGICVGVAAFLASTLLLTGPARSAEVDFRPKVELSLFRDGNVAIVGGTNVADEGARLALHLDLFAETPATKLRFSYRPYRLVYRDESDFDNTGHELVTDVRHDVSRKSSISVGLLASRTETQGISREQPDVPLSLVPRTTIDRATLKVLGRVGTGEKAFVTWGIGGEISRYEDVAGISFEDADEGSAQLGLGYQISARTTAGGVYRYQRISFETLETTQVHNLQFVLGHQFGRALTGDLRFGVLRTDTGGVTSSDPSYDLSLARTMARGSTLRFGVRQGVSAGSGITSATRDRGAYLNWDHPGRRRFRAYANVAYWRRKVLESVTAGITDSDFLTTSESVGWILGRRWFVGVFHGYTDQGNQGAGAEVLDTSYHSGGVTVRWMIRGERGQRGPKDQRSSR